jgi:oligopeptide transport system ATP-binding protein
VQAQVVNLLLERQKKMGLTYLFIALDLSMVRHISDKVGVMYMGRLMESASSTELYSNPLHPYTQACCRLYLCQIQLREDHHRRPS